MKYISKKLRIKSPLRYPGGKSRAIKQILPLIPSDILEFREPFVGGGSVFIALSQIISKTSFWINDINNDLYCFWKEINNNIDKLIQSIQEIFSQNNDGRKLYLYYKNENHKFSEYERAVRFFVLNRITFSGIADSGGYSQSAFEKRFTQSSIKRLEELKKIFNNIKVTNYDYNEVVNITGKNVFIFLDPPYYSVMKSKLYGKKGHLHTSFDHVRFAETMKKIKHRWLITYDDCPIIRDLFKFANITTWELQYGMNNYKQKTAAKGRELFISNYEFPKTDNILNQIRFFKS